VTIGSAIDPALPRAGTLFVYWLSAADAAQIAGTSLDLTGLSHLLDHLTLVGPVDLGRPGAGAAFRVPVEPGDVIVSAFLDTRHDAMGSFLSAATAQRGDLTGDAPHAVHVDTTATSNIVLDHVMEYPALPEACTGERHELVELDAPEVAGVMGNATHRRICVILPASYASGERRYPVVYEFPGWGFDDGRTMSELHHDHVFDELHAEAILAIVDTSTKAGSSYLLDSPRTGAWDTFLTTRAIPEIDHRYRTIATRDGRAVTGLSTGGFGALSFGLRHPELIGVVAPAAPDGPDVTRWLFGYPDSHPPAWSLGMIRIEATAGGAGFFASYGNDWSPDDSARGYALPIDLATGTAVPVVMAKWRAQGPARWLESPERAAAIKASFAGRLCLSVGKRDEFGLAPALQDFAAKLTRVGIANELLLANGGHIDPAVMTNAYHCAIEKLAKR
jgi:S-formylglutathione hydrolase FrmB